MYVAMRTRCGVQINITTASEGVVELTHLIWRAFHLTLGHREG